MKKMGIARFAKKNFPIKGKEHGRNKRDKKRDFDASRAVRERSERTGLWVAGTEFPDYSRSMEYIYGNRLFIR